MSLPKPAIFWEKRFPAAGKGWNAVLLFEIGESSDAVHLKGDFSIRD